MHFLLKGMRARERRKAREGPEKVLVSELDLFGLLEHGVYFLRICFAYAWQLVGLFSLAVKLSIRNEWSSVRVLSIVY